jgi:phospholipase A1
MRPKLSLYKSPRTQRASNLAGVLLLLLSQFSLAQSGAVNACLQSEVLNTANLDKTVRELQTRCSLQANVQQSDNIDSSNPIPTTPATNQRPSPVITGFFQPYKRNYITFGSMKKNNGGKAFSGNSLDIKFELGMKFVLFPKENSPLLAPLSFGYSQRSWWDIAESSAPFSEHNYNPEIFWDFASTRDTQAIDLGLHLIDKAGVEHQSNGLNGARSRSWDRAFMEREFTVSEAFSWKLKIWEILNVGEFNSDIEDYLGNASLGAKFNFNNWIDFEVTAMQGSKAEKISYQADLILPISQWVNSYFMLTYYDGFGEALISYNQKTRSMRAGFYLPLGF